MSTFIWVLVTWPAFSFIYAFFIADRIPDGLFWFILDFIIAAPAMIIMIACIVLYETIDNFFNRRKK